MQEKMKQLAELRNVVAAIKETQNRIYEEAIGNNPEYQELERKVSEAKHRIVELEEQLKFWALEQFAVDNNKKPLPKLSIREYTKVEYDVVKAKEWAMKNLTDAFEFNPKVFEKYATTVKCPDFAKIRKVPSASVGEDLTEYLQSKSEEI